MADPEHLKIFHQGVNVWNEWRIENNILRPSLHKLSFNGADLSWINFSRANLSGADLSGTELYNAHLYKANCSEANLYKANLYKAEFTGANLHSADLRMANLQQVRLYKANLVGAKLELADLRGANLRKALLRKADLSFANLSGANLRGVDFSRADLGYSDLSGANISGVNLSRAYINNANLSGANLNGANFQNSVLSQANLTKTNLKRASFVETKLDGADLSNSSVYGISAWNLKTNKDTKQLDLVITKDDEPIVTVDELEVAQFIYLLIRHERLREVINSVTKKGVLILGRLGGGGIEVLRAVAEKLRKIKFLPIIFDFDRPRDRNFTETVKTLAGLSKFVIVDLSGPSVPQELYATVPSFKIPFVPILEKGKQPYAMFADILEYDWVLKPIVEFDTTESLIEKLPSQIVIPAEKRHEKRQKLLTQLFDQ